LAAYWTVQHAIDMKVPGVGFSVMKSRLFNRSNCIRCPNQLRGSIPVLVRIESGARCSAGLLLRRLPASGQYET